MQKRLQWNKQQSTTEGDMLLMESSEIWPKLLIHFVVTRYLARLYQCYACEEHLISLSRDEAAISTIWMWWSCARHVMRRVCSETWSWGHTETHGPLFELFNLACVPSTNSMVVNKQEQAGVYLSAAWKWDAERSGRPSFGHILFV